VQYTFGYAVFGYTCLFHLQFHQLACQAYLAYIITAHTFYSDPATFIQYIVRIVAEELFAATLIERYLNYRVRLSAIMQRQIAEPVKNIEPVAAARAAAAITIATGRLAIGSRTTIATSHIELIIYIEQSRRLLSLLYY